MMLWKRMNVTFMKTLSLFINTNTNFQDFSFNVFLFTIEKNLLKIKQISLKGKLNLLSKIFFFVKINTYLML